MAAPGGPGDPRKRRGLLARLLGTRAERVAVRELKRRGYRILGRNLRTPRGEVDVLAEHEGGLVLVEVKSSRDGRRGSPALRVGAATRARLAAAGRWLTAQAAFRGRGFRLDLVAVTFDEGSPVVTIRPDAL
jgi:putative endonuclease